MTRSNAIAPGQTLIKILFLLCLPFLSFGQKKAARHYYFDEEFNPVSKKEAVYFGISYREGDHWLLYATYPDNSPVLQAYYLDKDIVFKDGPYKLFYPGNKAAVSCSYRNNKKYGLWRSWYENGQLRDSCLYTNDEIENEYKSWFAGGQLNIACSYKLNNTSSVKDGPYAEWYENGKQSAAGYFREGQFDSLWNFYHENGQPSTVEHYQNGKLASLSCYDTSGRYTGETCHISTPASVTGFGDYREFLINHLQLPQEAIKKRLSGTVHISVTVSKEGKPVKMAAVSNEPLLQQAVEAMLQQFKNWYPAISHNRPVEWNDEFDLPIDLSGEE